MDFLDLFSHGFIQRALVAGCFIAVLCSVLGTFLVLRRLSLIGDGLAHVTFGVSQWVSLFVGLPFTWQSLSSWQAPWKFSAHRQSPSLRRCGDWIVSRRDSWRHPDSQRGRGTISISSAIFSEHSRHKPCGGVDLRSPVFLPHHRHCSLLSRTPRHYFR